MDASSSVSTHAGHDPHQHHDEHGHHELSFLRKYVFSTDHKVIGLQYLITGLIFLFMGFCLIMLMRWQLAFPGTRLPVIGSIIENVLGPGAMANGVMTPDQLQMTMLGVLGVGGVCAARLIRRFLPLVFLTVNS